MSERNIDYISISKLGRGYAGQIIDQMNANESVIYVLRNNKPAAVIMSYEDYQVYLNAIKSEKRINKAETVMKSAGSLHEFAKPDKVADEREFYQMGIVNKYGK